MAREYAHFDTVRRELSPLDGVYTYRHPDRLPHPDHFFLRMSAEISVIRTPTPQEKIDETARQVESFKKMYANPLVNIAFTFIEPLPAQPAARRGHERAVVGQCETSVAPRNQRPDASRQRRDLTGDLQLLEIERRGHQNGPSREHDVAGRHVGRVARILEEAPRLACLRVEQPLVQLVPPGAPRVHRKEGATIARESVAERAETAHRTGVDGHRRLGRTSIGGQATDRTLVTVDASGHATKFAADARSYASQPRVSPDGHGVAVVISNAKGTYETWVAGPG